MGILDIPGVTKTQLAEQLNANRFAYNAKTDQLQKFRALLAQAMAGTSLVKIAAIGHSMIAGTGALPGVNDWVTRFRKLLEIAGYPSSGEGFITAYKNAPDPRVVAGAGWALYLAGYVRLQNSTTTNTLVFTPSETFTSVDVWYSLGSGVFTVSIDGAAATTITPAAGSGPVKQTFSGLSSSTHTVTVTRVSGAVEIHGVEVYRSATGTRIYNFGFGGLKATSLALSSAQSIAPFTLVVGAHLVFIECSYNDANATTPTTLASFKADIQTAITRVRTNGATAVLVTDSPTANAANVAPYSAALYELALSNDILLIDAGLALAGAISNGLIDADNIHPNAAGYAAQARAVLNAMAI